MFRLPQLSHPLFVQLITLGLVSALLTACGSAPKDVDREGLRDRADQETSQVK